MELNFKVALITVAILGASTVPGATYSGNLLKANGVSTQQEAEAYYAMIDPDNKRTNQTDWEKVNGFNDVDGINETIIVQGHKNISDLGFWRRIEMVIDKRQGYRGNVAMSTYNFELGPTADLNDPKNFGKSKCCNPGDAASIVNMEYSPGPLGDRITKFYIYDGKTGARKNYTFFDPGPDPENLYLPNGCASCHGGGGDFTAHGGKTGGGWLAFDFRVFEYPPNSNGRELNEANVKKLNRGVLMTNPPSAVKNLIYGLYGGKDLPRSTQVPDYMPADWTAELKLRNLGDNDNLRYLWKDVVVHDCLGCHTQSESEVLNVNYWKSNVGELREQVLKKRIMPNSPFANVRFWDDSVPDPHHTIVEDQLDEFRPPTNP